MGVAAPAWLVNAFNETVAPTVQDVDNAPLARVNLGPLTVPVAAPGTGPGNTTPSATAYVGSAVGSAAHAPTPLASSAVVATRTRVRTAGSSPENLRSIKSPPAHGCQQL